MALQGLAQLQQFLGRQPLRQRPIGALEAVGRGVTGAIPGIVQMAQQTQQLEAQKSQQVMQAIMSGTGADANLREVGIMAQRALQQPGAKEKYLQDYISGPDSPKLKLEKIENQITALGEDKIPDIEQEEQLAGLEKQSNRLGKRIKKLEGKGLLGMIERERGRKQAAFQEMKTLFNQRSSALQAGRQRPGPAPEKPSVLVSRAESSAVKALGPVGTFLVRGAERKEFLDSYVNDRTISKEGKVSWKPGAFAPKVLERIKDMPENIWAKKVITFHAGKKSKSDVMKFIESNVPEAMQDIVGNAIADQLGW